MTHSEVSSSLQLTVAREFKKNYRLFHRARQNSVSEEIAAKRAAKKTDYAGFS